MTVDTDMFQVLTSTKISSTSILEVDPNLFQRQKVGFYIKKKHYRRGKVQPPKYNTSKTIWSMSLSCKYTLRTNYGSQAETTFIGVTWGPSVKTWMYENWYWFIFF